VTVTAHRARPRRHARPGRVRAALAVAALTALLPTAACGIRQTSKPYNPADGVNFDVGNQDVPESVVHVRNMLIISRSPGTGILSASIVTRGQDALVGVSGVPYRANGSKGGAFTANLSGPIMVANNSLVVLTSTQPYVSITGASGLQAGIDADVTVQFGRAGSHTTRTTVVDGNLPPYDQISPSASPSASPDVTASPSPTP
jgi:hypothetical protein